MFVDAFIKKKITAQWDNLLLECNNGISKISDGKN